jgi:predicted transcriptional regulator
MATQKELPPDLQAQVNLLAKEQNRQPAELLEEAVRRYLKEERLERLTTEADRRNTGNGLFEGDVPRAVKEYRADKHRER